MTSEELIALLSALLNPRRSITLIKLIIHIIFIFIIARNATPLTQIDIRIMSSPDPYHS